MFSRCFPHGFSQVSGRGKYKNTPLLKAYFCCLGDKNGKTKSKPDKILKIDLENGRKALCSKQEKRQRNQRACGNGRKYTSGQFFTAETFAQAFMQTAGNFGYEFFSALRKESKGEKQKENEAKKRFFP